MEALKIESIKPDPIEKHMRNGAYMLLSLSEKYQGCDKIPYRCLDAIEKAIRSSIGDYIDLITNKNTVSIFKDGNVVDRYDICSLKEFVKRRRDILASRADSHPIHRIEISTATTKTDTTTSAWINIVDNPAINFKIVRFHNIKNAPAMLTKSIRRKSQTQTMTACADVIIEGRLKTVKMPTSIFETTVKTKDVSTHPLSYMERMAIDYAMVFGLRYGSDIDVRDDLIYISKGEYFTEDMTLTKDYFPPKAISNLYLDDDIGLTYPVMVDGIPTYTPEDIVSHYVNSIVSNNEKLIDIYVDDLNKSREGFVSLLYSSKVKFNDVGEMFCNSKSMSKVFGFTYSKTREFKDLPFKALQLMSLIEDQTVSSSAVIVFPTVTDRKNKVIQLKLKQGI